MRKHYLFKANGEIDKKTFENILSRYGISSLAITYQDETSGDIKAQDDNLPGIEASIYAMKVNFDIQISVLCAHFPDALCVKLLKSTAAYSPSKPLFPSEVLLKEMGFGDYSSFPLLASIFKGLNKQLLETAEEYLRCGLNACYTARKLMIHRNTLNYRLTRFADETRLDIREFHNACLLNLYFELLPRK